MDENKNENKLITVEHMKMSLLSVKSLIGEILNKTIDTIEELNNEITSTWSRNSSTKDGFVDKSEGQINKVWGTDEKGNPGWRDETASSSSVISVNGQIGEVNLTAEDVGAVNANNVKLPVDPEIEPTEIGSIWITTK